MPLEYIKYFIYRQQKGIKTMSNFLRITDVMKMTGIAKSTIWLWVSEDKFPQPIKLSPRITVWEEEKIEYWMKQKL